MVMWVLQAGMGLADTEDEREFLREGSPTTNLRLLPDQRDQARHANRRGGVLSFYGKSHRYSARGDRSLKALLENP